MKLKLSLIILAILATSLYFFRPAEKPQAEKIVAEPEQITPAVQETEPVVKQEAAAEPIVEEKPQYHTQPASPLLVNVNPKPVEKEKTKAEQFFEDFKKERVRDRRFKMENERMINREVINGPFNHNGSGLSRLSIECRSKTCLLTGKSRYPLHDDMMATELQQQLQHRNVRVEQIDYNRRTNSFAIALYPEKD